jgi:hypothetical protein
MLYGNFEEARIEPELEEQDHRTVIYTYKPKKEGFMIFKV